MITSLDYNQLPSGSDVPEDAETYNEAAHTAVEVREQIDVAAYPDGAVIALQGLVYATVSAPKQERLTTDGKRLELISYFDDKPQHSPLTERIAQRRRDRYVEEGIWQPDAREGDDLWGANIEVVAWVNADTGEPVASLRKRHTTESSPLTDLALYRKFAEAGAFSPDGLTLLEARTRGRAVVEIMGLWKDPAYSADVKVDLQKRALQDSMARNEVWFMGVVNREYRALLSMHGERVVHSLGVPITVEDGNAVNTLKLNPVLVDPSTYPKEMLDEIATAKAAGDMQAALRREIVLWHMIDGVDWHTLFDAETVQRMQEL